MASDEHRYLGLPLLVLMDPFVRKYGFRPHWQHLLQIGCCHSFSMAKGQFRSSAVPKCRRDHEQARWTQLLCALLCHQRSPTILFY